MPRGRENQVKLICEVCGKEHSVSKSRATKYKHHYCSQECYKKQRQELHTVLTTCDYCGKTIKIEKADFDRCKKNHFCGVDCWKKFLNTNEYILHEKFAEIKIKNKKFGDCFVKIDLEDVDRCKQYTWNLWYEKTKRFFYVNTVITLSPKKLKTIWLHRFIMNYEGDLEIDHLNHDVFDNRKNNLQIVSREENMQNLRQFSSKQDGYRGVSWDKQTKKWRVHVSHNYKNYHGGYFDDKEVANEKAIEMRNKIFTHNVLDRQSQLDI